MCGLRGRHAVGSGSALPTPLPDLPGIASDSAARFSLFGVVSGADRVFHLAAAVGVRRIVDHPLESLRTNLHGARSLEALWIPNSGVKDTAQRRVDLCWRNRTSPCKAASQVGTIWDLRELQSRVTAAQQTGGWLQLTFHRVCTDGCSNPIAVDRALFAEFVSWLAAERDAGRAVRAGESRSVACAVGDAADPGRGDCPQLRSPH